jgi:hypothetical protein
MSEKVDEPLTESDKRQMWRMATFQCRCEEDNQYVKKMVHIPSARIAPFFSSEKAFLM